MKKLYLSLLTAALACGSAFAQERDLYFSFGEDQIVDNGANIVYYGGAVTWCPMAFSNGFIANIIAHVDVAIKGKAQVVLTALDKQEASMYLADDEGTDHGITFAPDYQVALEFRALPGQKKELTIECGLDPNNIVDGVNHSYRMKLDINRPECEEGCFPVIYENVESITLVFSDNPADILATDPVDPPVDPVDPPVDPVDPPVDPVDPPVDPGDDPDDPTDSIVGVLSDANPVIAAGNMLYYQLAAPEAVDVYSVSGAHVYGGVAETDGATNLGFLPAGLYLYKVGNHTGKILVR